jgi:predicted DNA-binding mobile mystery protein A
MSKYMPLALMQINRRLQAISGIKAQSQVSPGWIRFMRQAFGLTMKVLADRVGVTPSAIAQAERGEVAGKISLSTLRQIASAMDCEVIYSFVPKGGKDITVESILKKHAFEKATRIILSADLHMTLEDQKVNQPLDERIQILADELFRNRDVW